eukprot:366555-Chlamydomonas_euryale.AAC.15
MRTCRQGKERGAPRPPPRRPIHLDRPIHARRLLSHSSCGFVAMSVHGAAASIEAPPVAQRAKAGSAQNPGASLAAAWLADSAGCNQLPAHTLCPARHKERFSSSM